MPSFLHLYEGVLPWSLLSFSISWCSSPWCGCSSCSSGRGLATVSRSHRPSLHSRYPDVSVAASRNPLRASPANRTPTPVTLPIPPPPPPLPPPPPPPPC